MKTEIYDETMAIRVALHPFLAGMNRQQQVLLADCAMSIRFQAGDVILRAADHADRFYLIETGAVVLEAEAGKGESVVVDTIGAGDLLGWSWMFPPYIWQFTARAIAPTRAIFFAGSILREYCERDHLLGYELLKRITAVMNRRMQNARRKMLGLHSGTISLPPVVLQSPFMDQELDTLPDDSEFNEGADEERESALSIRHHFYKLSASPHVRRLITGRWGQR